VGRKTSPTVQVSDSSGSTFGLPPLIRLKL
jgi:hypothetical protein